LGKKWFRKRQKIEPQNEGGRKQTGKSTGGLQQEKKKSVLLNKGKKARGGSKIKGRLIGNLTGGGKTI